MLAKKAVTNQTNQIFRILNAFSIGQLNTPFVLFKWSLLSLEVFRVMVRLLPFLFDALFFFLFSGDRKSRFSKSCNVEQILWFSWHFFRATWDPFIQIPANYKALSVAISAHSRADLEQFQRYNFEVFSGHFPCNSGVVSVQLRYFHGDLGTIVSTFYCSQVMETVAVEQILCNDSTKWSNHNSACIEEVII